MPSTGVPLNKALAGALKKAKQLARAEGVRGDVGGVGLSQAVWERFR